jgi:hypothetical protein
MRHLKYSGPTKSGQVETEAIKETYDKLDDFFKEEMDNLIFSLIQIPKFAEKSAIELLGKLGIWLVRNTHYSEDGTLVMNKKTISYYRPLRTDKARQEMLPRLYR